MTCCTGLPWTIPSEAETPLGMLERPPGCLWPKACAADRICWDAVRYERAGWHAHKLMFFREERAGRTEGETFEEWAGKAA